MTVYVYSGLSAVGKTELVKRELLESSQNELSDRRIIFLGFSEKDLPKEYLLNFNSYWVIDSFSVLIAFLQLMSLHQSIKTDLNDFVVIDESQKIFQDTDKFNLFYPLFLDALSYSKIDFLFISNSTAVFPKEFKQRIDKYYLITRFLPFRIFIFCFRGFLFKRLVKK